MLAYAIKAMVYVCLCAASSVLRHKWWVYFLEKSTLCNNFIHKIGGGRIFKGGLIFGILRYKQTESCYVSKIFDYVNILTMKIL